LDDAAPGVLAFARAGHVVALNCAGDPRPAPRAGALRLSTWGARGVAAPPELAPGDGFVATAAG
ncbi:MAG: hypothetical protein QOI11_2454, partial [Candidatus Eremiobacteraeota bacterium]|nr:hypothetical protein [Candidatus Eremiobacteraeota bacterium]